MKIAMKVDKSTDILRVVPGGPSAVLVRDDSKLLKSLLRSQWSQWSRVCFNFLL
jgi:hypothetical protein